LGALEQHRKELPEDRRMDWILTRRTLELEQSKRQEPAEDWMGNNKFWEDYLTSAIAKIRDEQRRLIELDQQLPRLVKEANRPPSNPYDRSEWARKRIILARRCASPHWRLYGASARLFLQGRRFLPEGDERTTGTHYEVARVLALAGCGQGADTDSLDDSERVRLRQQSLTYIRADLDALTKMKRKNASISISASPVVVARTLNRWHRDPALTGVRDESALAKLPASERAEWIKLWADAAALRKKLSECQEP
jgi:hypothetical protein